MTALLEIDNLWVEGCPPGGKFKPIVKGISLSVNRGEVLALIGESGSGKSTICLAALAYTRPGCRFSGGNVLLEGQDVLALDSSERRPLRGAKVAYVAQSAAAAFNPALTIGRQVTEGPQIHNSMTATEADRRAVETYRSLDLPTPELLGKLYPHQVSGGQLQRLMAAMAVSCDPMLLLLDEPTTALDVTTQIEVLTAFKAVIKQHNSAAIYVTHDLSVVAQIADRIIVLNDGTIMEQGTTQQIIEQPTHEYTKKLMMAVRPPPRSMAGGGTARVDPSARPAPILEVRGITAGYGRVKKKIVLRDVDLTVSSRQVVGVIGESGCGKSTLARVISGLLPQVSGEIARNGTILAPAVEQRSKSEIQSIQIVFQMADVALNPRQRIRDIIGRPLEFYMNMGSAARLERVGELLELVELPRDFATRFPKELSGGEKQRVNLARALAAEPDVILCDEVASSLDTVVGAAIIELLKDLQEKLGVAYVFISHDLSTVASFADEIMVLYAGRVVERGPTMDVLSPPFHPYTRLLLSSVPEIRQGWLEDVMKTREAISGISREVELTEVGCPFFARCPLAIDGTCDRLPAPLQETKVGHLVACHRNIEELAGEIIQH